MRRRLAISILVLSCSSVLRAQRDIGYGGGSLCSDRSGHPVVCSPCALYGVNCGSSSATPTASSTNNAIVQGLSPGFQGLFNSIGQSLANSLFGNPAAAAAARAAEAARQRQEAEWQAQQARQWAEERRRRELDLHNRLMSELKLLSDGGNLQPMLLSDGAPNPSDLMPLDGDNLAPAGTSFFGLGGGKPAEPAAVSAANLRRAAYLAEKAADAAPGDAAFLMDEALSVADGKAPFVVIPDNAVPIVSEDGLRAFQQANIDYRRAHSDSLAASQRVIEADRNRQMAEEVRRRVQEENAKGELTAERRRLMEEAEFAVRRFTEESDRAWEQLEQAQNSATVADAFRRLLLNNPARDVLVWQSFLSGLQSIRASTDQFIDHMLRDIATVQPGPAGHRKIQEGIFLGLTQGQQDVDQLMKKETSPFCGRQWDEMHRAGEALGLAFGIHTEGLENVREYARGVADHLSVGTNTLDLERVKNFLPGLQGTEFNRLLAHSNGATVAEALIRADVIKVHELNILGGDRSLVNRDSLNELLRAGKVDRVVIWINPGDPIPMLTGTDASKDLELYRAAEHNLIDSLNGVPLSHSDAKVEYRYLQGKGLAGQELGIEAHSLRGAYLPNLRSWFAGAQNQ